MDFVLDEAQGVFVPAAEYGGPEDFSATALFADFEGDGFLAGCAFACDMTFEASFSVATGSELVGDLNGDGFVGAGDLDILLGVWNQSVSGDVADLNADGFIGAGDLDILLGNWNAGTPPTAGVGVVPEPASAALVSLGGLALLRRR